MSKQEYFRHKRFIPQTVEVNMKYCTCSFNLNPFEVLPLSMWANWEKKQR